MKSAQTTHLRRAKLAHLILDHGVKATTPVPTRNLDARESKVISFDNQEDTFDRNGFLLLRGAVDPQVCRAFGEQVTAEYRRLIDAGWRFADSGRLSGHLNIRMGSEGRTLLEAFRMAGLEELIQRVAGKPMGLTQAVGNLNLPGSCAQDFHMDGGFDNPIMIANICLAPTDSINGATELVPGSNTRELSYWRFVRDGWRGQVIAPHTSPGDVLIRWSNVWHRGTPNHSSAGRPMAAFTYAPEQPTGGGERCPDLDGPLTLFGNKYYGRFRRAKELVAARLPLLDEALRQGRSFLTARNLGRALTQAERVDDEL